MQIVLLPDVCVDHAMNTNLQSNTINFYYDTVDPTPTLTTFAPAYTKKLTYDINVTFDEPIVNFTVADISTYGAVTLHNFTVLSDYEFRFQAVPLVRSGSTPSEGTETVVS